MPRKCCIDGCSNSQVKSSFLKKEISFHSFPKSEKMLLDWIHSIKIITGQVIDDRFKVRICSEHFLESEVKRVNRKAMLDKLAVPCIFKHSEFTNYEVLFESVPVSNINYDNYVLSGLMSYLLGYKFSQDHLETMFAIIRCKGGFNNNPNCLQFKSAFKRLLMRNQLTSSLNANCLNSNDDFLAFTKLKKEISKNSFLQFSQFFEDDIFDVWEDTFDEANTLQLSEYAIDIVAYIAGFVERSVKKKIKCEDCLNALSKSIVFDGKLIQVKNRGGLVYPQTDIFNVCKTAEQTLGSSDLSKNNFYNRLFATVC